MAVTHVTACQAEVLGTGFVMALGVMLVAQPLLQIVSCCLPVCTRSKVGQGQGETVPGLQL